MKNGAEHPEIVDLVTSNDDSVILIIIQTEKLNNRLLSRLEEKINNYLSFAKDGQMLELYPETEGKDITIRLDMYEDIDRNALEFCKNAKDVLSQKNVNFVWSECEYDERL